MTQILAYPYAFFSAIKTYLEDNKFKKRVKYEYNYLARKKESLGTRLMPIAGFMVTVLFAILVLKQVVFLGVIVTGSMMPTIMPADLVLFEAITLDNVNSGDVITFIPPGSVTQIVHRVASIKDGKYKTKGDNVGATDDWVLTREDILGKAIMYNGRPIILKHFGWFFMPLRRTYIPGSDQSYEFVKFILDTIHQQGPVLIIIIILLMVVSSFGKKKYRYDISG